MARIRTIKPEFFRHEELQDLEAANPGYHVMLVFAALWGHCDKEGRFLWKPRTMKLDILPFLDFDLGASMMLLCEAGLIKRYEVDGVQYGFVPTFKEHQRISGKEAQEPSKYPEPVEKTNTCDKGSAGEAPGKHSESQEGKGREKEGKGEIQPPAAARPASLSVSDLAKLEVSEDVAREFLQIRKRKRAPLTKLALDGIRREAGRAGMTLDAALRKCIERGWQGFEASWVERESMGAVKHGNFAQQDYHAGVSADGRF